MIGSLGVGLIDEQRGYDILEVAGAVAGARGVSVAQVALNWLRSRPQVSSIIVGARTTDQLTENLQAASWTLTDEEAAQLDTVSATELLYPHWYQRQFTAERFGREGAPPGAFDYRFEASESDGGP
jgi:diketogulonate reductase-like aldo/keto reductase